MYRQWIKEWPKFTTSRLKLISIYKTYNKLEKSWNNQDKSTNFKEIDLFYANLDRHSENNSENL